MSLDRPGNHPAFTVDYILPSIAWMLRLTSFGGAVRRKFVMSRNGGAPNRRLYSRLNCEGLS
jgi:hypothetical protein